MPGFLGGSSGGTGSGGEISFPKEFIDPVTKLRISQPENLIDTDFEYGLQPTKWETVELINNTPSFFSKSGDTTIPGIRSITTNAGTREITVTTDFDHLLSVGIPISVTGTKSVTADGAYIINSIPNTTTFTYLCKANQGTTASIEDLYSSIITGEFFQGSQLRIADASGIVTNDASVSTLTVTTESSHGFKVNTPFYFLNLNSTISQDFPATNTTAKSFDSTNSATAQTFDGSNTLSSINIDWSNSATIGGNTSTISSISTINNTITVAHGLENFANQRLGTPLYYSITGGAGYFLNNPRGVVFLKTIDTLGASTSTFQVSTIPDGDVIPITASISGTFQLANQARTFAGNNVNPITQTTVEILKGEAKAFDATNTLGLTGTVTGYSGSNITVTSPTVLEWYTGTMLLYNSSTNQPPTTTPSNLITNNTTYFVDSFFRQGTSNLYSFTIKPLPNGSVIGSIAGGAGTQTFKQIGISLDKDIFHVKDNGFTANEMLEYEYPPDGRFGVVSADEIKNFYFIQTLYDAHNFTLNQTTGDLTPLTVSITVNRGTAITPTTATPSGLTAPITFAVTSGVLPNGLSLNTTTGSVSGVPVEVVTGRVVVITATDASGSTAFQTHTYTVNATVGSIDPATVSRENIFSGVAMTSTTATTNNLVAPITWAISSGTLPTGLNFNNTNGVISGTPTEIIAAPGRQVIVRATDVGGLQGFQTVTFQINPPPELYAFSSATFTPGGASGPNGPTISQARSGVGNPSWAATYLNMPVQGIQQWTVPRTATYRILAVGAGGNPGADRSGRGAFIQADFALTEGQILEMAVGQIHDGRSSCGTGGYGGTFVTLRTTGTGTVSTSWGTVVRPLVIAGGGGGRVDDASGSSDASTGSSGRSSPQSGSSAGGTNGNGGGSTSSPGGAGLVGAGQTNWNGNMQGGNRTQSRPFISNPVGTTGIYNAGGYGAGANGTCDVCNSTAHAGGAGGYSGGAGGGQSGSCYGGSGGGGSFIGSGATNVSTSDGGWARTGSEPHSPYTGGVSSNGSWNTSGSGYIAITRL